MKKAKNFVTNLSTNVMFYLAGVKPAKRKMERGDQLVEFLGLMVVALLIVFLFKDKLIALVTEIIDQIGVELKKLFPTAVVNPTP